MSVLTLQPASAAGLDNTIYSDDPTTNYGLDIVSWLGDYGTGEGRFLIKFAGLTDLPDDAIIDSAILDLYLESATGSASGNTLFVYRQKRAWVENQSTWNIYSTGNNWVPAGGFGADDCEQTGIGSQYVSRFSAPTHLEIALIAASKADLDLGNGWLVKCNSPDCYFTVSTSGSATAAQRPKLTVTYHLPAAILRFPWQQRHRRRMVGV